jgi:hypothetical protein
MNSRGSEDQFLTYNGSGSENIYEQYQQQFQQQQRAHQSSYDYGSGELRSPNGIPAAAAGAPLIRTFSDQHLGVIPPTMMPPSPSPGSPVPKRPEATFVMDISPSVVGWIIGRSGIRIKEIQAQTGCKMWVDQDVPNDQPRKIYFHGSKPNIDAAVSRVSELVQTAPILASASVTSGKGLTSTIVDCPASLVGLLIGKRGWTIKKIQQASGAQISINQSVREGLPRKIIVSGDETSVATALHLIDEVLRDKSGLSQELESSSPYDSPMYLNNGMENYGSTIYDPRLQGLGGPSMAYRQQFQSMSGTPPPIMQHSPGSHGIVRYPSPASLRSGEDPRSRMPAVGSYESSTLHQQMLRLEQLNGYGDGLGENQIPGGGDSYGRPHLYSDDHSKGSPNQYIDDFLRKNSEADRWNSSSGSALADSMLELNLNSSNQSSDNNSYPTSNRSSREDGSLLSYHLRQQHQKSLQQAQQFQQQQQQAQHFQNPQQGHVFPLTQSKLAYRAPLGTAAPSGTQPIFISEYSRGGGGGMGMPPSPIDTSHRTLSDSSSSIYRVNSQSNSFYSSSLNSESPLNATPYLLGSSPNDSFRVMPTTTAVGNNYHPGIALESNRSRLSSSSSSESYLEQHGHIAARSYPLHNSDPYSMSGIPSATSTHHNRMTNQIDDANPLNHSSAGVDLNYQSISYPYNSPQQKGDHSISRSLPNPNSYETEEFYSSKHHYQQQQQHGYGQTLSPVGSVGSASSSAPTAAGSYKPSSSHEDTLFSPLYSNEQPSPSRFSDQGLGGSSPQKKNSLYDELSYGGFPDNFLEVGLTSLLDNNNPEVESNFRTSFGSIGSIGSGSLHGNDK